MLGLERDGNLDNRSLGREEGGPALHVLEKGGRVSVRSCTCDGNGGSGGLLRRSCSCSTCFLHEPVMGAAAAWEQGVWRWRRMPSLKVPWYLHLECQAGTQRLCFPWMGIAVFQLGCREWYREWVAPPTLRHPPGPLLAAELNVEWGVRGGGALPSSMVAGLSYQEPDPRRQVYMGIHRGTQLNLCIDCGAGRVSEKQACEAKWSCLQVGLVTNGLSSGLRFTIGQTNNTTD